MSSPSLAGEIAQLHELFKLGALTEEEFNTAKQATIRNFMSRAPTSPEPASAAPTPIPVNHPSASPQVADASNNTETTPSLAAVGVVAQSADNNAAPAESTASASSAPPLPSASPVRSREAWQQLWSRSPLHFLAEASTASAADPVDVRTQALRCADRLLRNLQAHPTEAKYKRIREANRVIAQELLVVEASAALLTFAGFQREVEEDSIPALTSTTTPPSALPTSSAGGQSNGPRYVWVQHDAPAEATRKAAATCRLVGHLLAYMGELQARRYGVQQLWRSVALEVRLETAGRAVAASGPEFLNFLSGMNSVHSTEETRADLKAENEESEEEVQREAESSSTENATATTHPFLAYLVECYTVDEAGDGLYSAAQHLRTLQSMYEAQLNSPSDAVAPSSVYSLIETADIYGAVVQQRGALELLWHGCGAQLHPCPIAAQRIATTTTTATTPAPATPVDASPAKMENSTLPTANEAQALYSIDLLPPSARVDPAAHVHRCLQLLRRVQDEVEKTRQRRTHDARVAAEKSMRQELRRERQRQQLEQSRVRGEVETENEDGLRRRRAKLHGPPQPPPPLKHAASSASSSSSSSFATSPRAGDDASATTKRGRGAAEAEGRRRIPIAEALAILMGKKSPPLSRPPAASSS